MSDKTAVVLTAKSTERILREGGTSSWRLDRNHARQCVFAVCARNAYAQWVEGPEVHHSAFLVGKVRDVVPSPDQKGRYLIQFSEYALVDVPHAWRGDRNPIRYTTMQEIGIDPATLKWKQMAEPGQTDRPTQSIVPLTLAEAKSGLASAFGVSPAAIEITIRA